jgi:hypothetical protein
MVCYVNFLSATSPDTMDGSPARSIALIHQLHVAGEEGGSATMVAVFLPVLPVGVMLWLSSRDVTRSSYVAVGSKKLKEGPARGLGVLHFGPRRRAPHQGEDPWGIHTGSEGDATGSLSCTRGPSDTRATSEVRSSWKKSRARFRSTINSSF